MFFFRSQGFHEGQPCDAQLARVQIKESSPLFQSQHDRPDLIDQAVTRDSNLVI